MTGHSLLIQAMVYLAAGVLSVPIAKRLGLGSVLGYLAAGPWWGLSRSTWWAFRAMCSVSPSSAW
jgi:Kef-type K+ transport system membrane component KefB